MGLAAAAKAADELTFNTPDDAVSALVTAAKNHDTNSMHAILAQDMG